MEFDEEKIVADGVTKKETQENNVQPSFQDLHLRITAMLQELQEKRADHMLNQREMSKVVMKANEHERMLECERRSLAGLQKQLEFQSQSLRKKESEVESAVQKAVRLEVQLALANQEIGVLRKECQNLEVQVLDITQKFACLDEQMKKMTAFKDMCSGLQEKVKTYMATSEKATTLLKTEMTNLKAETEKSCTKGINFEATMTLFENLQKKQELEYERIKQVIMDRKKKIDELQTNLAMLKKQSNGVHPLATKISELQTKNSDLEERLESERKVTKQFKDILSMAVRSQEALQVLESETCAKLTVSEAQLAASVVNEECMKREIVSLREEVSKLQTTSNKALSEKSVQTESPNGGETNVIEKREERKLSESARNLEEVKRQFQSAITASGDDWSKYVGRLNKN